MGQDVRAGFSLGNGITHQFTPPHVPMLHLSLAKCTWVEMRHGDGPRLWTLSKHGWIVCHMLHHAQVSHQNGFKLERIHPSCSYLIWAFTPSSLSLNILLLIGVFFLSRTVATKLEHLWCCLVCRLASVNCAHTMLSLNSSKSHNLHLNTAVYTIAFC